MAIELKVPDVGESITEVEIGEWLKSEGDAVKKDEPVVTLESEKASVDLPAPADGTLLEVLKQKGSTARVGEVIARLGQNGEKKAAEPAASAEKAEQKPAKSKSTPKAEQAKPEAKPAKAKPQPEAETEAVKVMPAAQHLLDENNLRAEEVEGTGPSGRLLKEDVLRHLSAREAKPEPRADGIAPVEEPVAAPAEQPKEPATSGEREEEVVPMTRLRRTLAQRLVDAQHTAALLTTINEIDMSAVMALRKEFGEAFQQKHQVKLGFMSFFIKAVVETLKQIPQLNAEVREKSIVYRNFYDVGVAIGGGKGLVVPVLRNAERMSFAEIEIAIHDFAQRAKDAKLKLEELQGGTFTISNGGVYGSLLSTPIVNPPQSGILGIHAIQERPVAVAGQVVIRPMMYVALTYDHRIVDGREAVTFLKRVKELVERPARILIEI